MLSKFRGLHWQFKRNNMQLIHDEFEVNDKVVSCGVSFFFLHVSTILGEHVNNLHAAKKELLRQQHKYSCLWCRTFKLKSLVLLDFSIWILSLVNYMNYWIHAPDCPHQMMSVSRMLLTSVLGSVVQKASFSVLYLHSFWVHKETKILNFYIILSVYNTCITYILILYLDLHCFLILGWPTTAKLQWSLSLRTAWVTACRNVQSKIWW